jgi:hypothetical protein
MNTRPVHPLGKATRISRSVIGPLGVFANVLEYACSSAVPEQGLGPAGAVLRMRRPAARGALRCSPWGRAAKLAALTAFVALGQLRRVSLRSARVRAPTPGLRSSPSQTQPATGRPQALRERSFLGESVWHATGIEPEACRAPQARHRAQAGLDARLVAFSNKEPSLPRQAVGGCAVACLCGGEEHRASVGARTRALRELTRRNCPSATNAVSEASFAARPKPEHRSAVGANGADRRSGAPPHTHPRLGAGLHVALQSFEDRNGPQADSSFMRCGTRAARWSN